MASCNFFDDGKIDEPVNKGQPRSGLDDLMIDTIMKSRIKKIVYVSCNPATLGKNLSVLSKRYSVEKIIPVDMFPQTAHVESVTVLKRKK